MDEEAELFRKLCSQLFVPAVSPSTRYADSTLAARLCELSERLLQAAQTIDSQIETNTRAYERVAITQRRPCRKGAELKDCTIFEECLAVCRSLQERGFPKKMVYCTSNTDDYCMPSVTPHPEIAEDCQAVGMLFTTNLPWAIAEISS